MKVIGCMATYEARAKTRKRAIDSIEPQLDELHVIDNSWKGTKVDRADNAKFLALEGIKEPCFMFTLDDDLIYPPDYVAKTIAAIKEFGCIITHHGRQLLGEGLHYYKGHRAFKCLEHVQNNEIVDVPGTGVTAFDTRYFHPKGLADSPDLRMSDLVFGLEAAKQKKQIGIISHELGWIRHINNRETIYETESRNGIRRQNEIADEIYRLNNKYNN